MAWVISPGGIWVGGFHQGADSLEHLARGQIDGGISPGGRKIGTPCLGADGWGMVIGLVSLPLKEEKIYVAFLIILK